MELAPSTLRGFGCSRVRFHTSTSTSGQHLPSLSSVRFPPSCKRLPSLGHTFTGCNFVGDQVRLQQSSLGAVDADSNTMRNICTEERVSPFDASDSASENIEQTKSSEKRDVNDDIKALNDDKLARICDKLIDVFMVDKPNPTEWRKLLVVSRNWIDIRSHFYKRCQDRAESEDDPEMKHKLSRLRRKLKEVDEDIQRHNELIELIKGAPSEIGAIVARRRKDFTREFFVHFNTVAEFYYGNPTEQNDLARLGDVCLAAVQNYDKASQTQSIEALNTAELKFKDILNSPSVGADSTTISNIHAEERVSHFDASDSASENGEQTKSSEKRDDANVDIEALNDDMTRRCDKLIDYFMVDKPNPREWRKLLAYSRQWIYIRAQFFKRCQDRAESEDDPGLKFKLSRLRRKLKEVDEDVQRHNELIELIKGAPSEIGAIVARRRKDFTEEFFEHFYYVAESYYENPTEQDDLARLGEMCSAAVQNYDEASESIEALNTAELKFKDILNSPSVDVACQKIDNLAQENQLDSALMLTIGKAWSTAQESTIGKDEAKDMMYHLYITAIKNFQKQLPKEVRIVQYLLTIKDPEELLCALNDAFTPGVEIEEEDSDYLYTTPEELHTFLKTLIDSYHDCTVPQVRQAKLLLILCKSFNYALGLNIIHLDLSSVNFLHVNPLLGCITDYGDNRIPGARRVMVVMILLLFSSVGSTGY
ncbi:hypothetical protein Vadar_024326 [Vaccinium darrowii]|uniref:Uncharacterized protein n=1 Tax=Vaccinium darrowii TaxID=229202 RepID=A0ACB7YA19_9ERIC|nr:hypothetical protein Vadar_024326 [Vaccinium darrowii]